MNDLKEIFCMACGDGRSIMLGSNTWLCEECGSHDVLVSYYLNGNADAYDITGITVYGTLSGKKFASISSDRMYQRHFVGGYKLPSYIMLADMKRDVVTLWN